MGVPVPKGYKIIKEEEVEDSLNSVGFPVAIKPLDSNHGKGITANITTLEEAKKGISVCKKIFQCCDC